MENELQIDEKNHTGKELADREQEKRELEAKEIMLAEECERVSGVQKVNDGQEEDR